MGAWYAQEEQVCYKFGGPSKASKEPERLTKPSERGDIYQEGQGEPDTPLIGDASGDFTATHLRPVLQWRLGAAEFVEREQ